MNSVDPISEGRVCPKCKIFNLWSNFHKSKSKKTGHMAHCKPCRKKISAERYKNNREKIDVTNAKWRKLNKERTRELDRIAYWKDHAKTLHKKAKTREKHRIVNRQRVNAYHKKLRDSGDPIYKLSKNLRRRLNKAIREDYKNGSAVQDLGISIPEFKAYMESKFYLNPNTGEQMTWDNWGKFGWHIDHILPVSSFDLMDREHVKKCCHYTNLQPLWSFENLSKGSKLPSNAIRPQSGVQDTTNDH